MQLHFKAQTHSLSDVCMVSNIIFCYIFTGFFELDLTRPQVFFWGGGFIVVLEIEPGALNMVGKH